VHFKDAKLLDPAIGLTAWAPIGEGAVDVDGQVADLLRDDFRGPVLLETHWRGEGLSGEQSSRRSFAGLVTAIDRAGTAARRRDGPGAGGA
jgi:sugar phosphate isomerase/epimerase